MKNIPPPLIKLLPLLESTSTPWMTTAIKLNTRSLGLTELWATDLPVNMTRMAPKSSIDGILTQACLEASPPPAMMKMEIRPARSHTVPTALSFGEIPQYSMAQEIESN